MGAELRDNQLFGRQSIEKDGQRFEGFGKFGFNTDFRRTSTI